MGGKSGSGQTVGYWYYPAYHDGLGVGPIDAFLEFRAGDKTAWSGELTASGTISINAPNLFGGEKDQGGIVGAVDVMFGEATQMPNAYLAATFGPQQPAWRGMTTLAFKGGKYGAMNPYPQEAAYKIRKIVKGWDDDDCWYPEKAEVLLGSVSATVGDVVTATGSIGGAAISAYLFVDGSSIGFAQAADGVNAGGSYTVGTKAPDLTTAGSNNITWQAGSPGDERLWLRGVSPAGYGISADNSTGRCELFQNGIYKATLVPHAAYNDSPWWYAEQWYLPEYGGLVWFSGASVYIGVRTVGSSPDNHNKIYRWALSATGTNVAANAASPRIGIGAESIFWMHLSRGGNVYTLDPAGVVKEFSPDLVLLSTYAPSLPTGTIPSGIGVDGDTLVILDARATAQALIFSLSTGTLLESVSHANIATSTVRRVVFTDEGIYVQCGASLLRIDYTPGSGGSPTGAMNPAHILHYALTQSDLGRESTANLPTDNWTAAADWYYSQGFGLCQTAYDPSAESVDEFSQRVQRVAGCSVSRSPIDGKWYIDIANGEYDLESLPILTDDDILEFREQPTLLDSAVNSVSIKYFDPQRKEFIVTPPTQAPALIDAYGTNHVTLEYPEIPAAELALRVAHRELLARITPLRGFSLKTTRQPYSWRCGTYFRLQAAKRGIADMVCVLGEKSGGQLRSGAMSITATQDVYSLPSTVFVEVEEGVDTSPPQAPEPITLQRAFEAPYIDVVVALPRAELAALPDDVGFLEAVAVDPAASLDFSMFVQPAGGDYTETASGNWCPSATLVEAAGPTRTEFTIADGYRLDEVTVGMPVLLNGEICRVDALDLDLETISLGRGCADTVPPSPGHAAGSRLWFWQAARATDTTEYTDGETVNVKLLTNTGSQQLDVSLATAMEVELASRAARPYPPGLFRINAAAYPVYLFGELTVTWAHRDRVLQADQVIDTEEASIGPEAGTTYTVRVYLNDTLVNTHTGITDTDATYLPLANGTVRVELESVRDGLTSWQMHSHEFDFTTAEVSVIGTEDSNELTTEDGVTLTTE